MIQSKRRIFWRTRSTKETMIFEKELISGNVQSLLVGVMGLQVQDFFLPNPTN